MMPLKISPVPRTLSSAAALAAGVMAVSFCFSFALFNIGAAVLMACFVLRRVREKNPRLFDPLMDGAALLFFLSGALSFFQSRYPAMSLEGIQKLFRYLFLFVAARESLASPGDANRTAWLLALGGAVAGCDTIFQWFSGYDLIDRQTPMVGFNELVRFRGPFGNPNMLAIYLVYFIPLMLLLARSLKETKARLALFGLGLITAAALGLTYSRPAATALALAFAVLTVVKKDWRLLAAAFALASAGALLAPPDIRGWVASLGSWGGFFYDQSRDWHHQAALNMIASHPLAGVGLNTFDVNYQAFRAAGDRVTRWSAHQAYLQIWAETGLAGLLSFLGLIGALLRYACMRYRRAQAGLLKDVLLGYLLGAGAFLFIGFFESNFWQPRQTNFFWFWAGLLCATAKLTEDAP